MRTSVTSLSQKLISTFFAATLAIGLMPAAAFAVNDSGESSPQNSGDANASSFIQAEAEASAYENNQENIDGSNPVADASASAIGDATTEFKVTTGDEANLGIPVAGVINQTMPLEVIAKSESTRSYFLAQTLESTKTVPIVSANLPLYTPTVEEVIEPETDTSAEGDAGEEGESSDDDPDLAGAIELPSNAVAAESTVIGSFTYNGITYAVEPGGETVAVVAADYAKLPEVFIEAQTIVLPSAATAAGVDYYSVTRIADYAFSSITRESVGACFSLRDGEEGTEDNAQASAATSTLDDSDGVSEEESNGITAVTIPASITTIDPDAFTDFNTLQYIIVSEDNPAYSQYDGALYNADQTCLLLIPEGRLGAVRVAPSVTEVSPEAFSHCPSVSSLVTDPDSAAFQLLQENDFNNANDKSIDVITDSAINVAFIATYKGSYGNVQTFLSDIASPDTVQNGLLIGSDGEELTDEQSTMGADEIAFISKLDNGTSEIHVTTLDGQTFDTLDSTTSQRQLLAAGGTYTFAFSMVPDIYYTADTWNTPKAPVWDSSGKTFSNSSPLKRANAEFWYRMNENIEYTGIQYDSTLTDPAYGAARWGARLFSKSGGYYIYDPCLTASSATRAPALDSKGLIIQRKQATIYAHAVANKYTVTFSPNGASTANQGTTSLGVTYNSAVSKIAIPHKRGYRFDGYFASIDEQGHGVGEQWFDEDGNYVKLKTFVDYPGEETSYRWGTVGNVTLQAGYTALAFDTTLDTKGAVTPEVPQTIHGTWKEPLSDTDVNGNPLQIPTRPGYEFAGFWSTPSNESDPNNEYYRVVENEDGTKSLEPVPGKTWDIDDDVTLYAHWSYRIALDANVHNFKDSAGNTVTGSIDSSFPNIEIDETTGLGYLWVLDGEPVQLPTASREGYSDTRAWGLLAGTGTNAGRAYYVLPMASVDGAVWSVKSASDKIQCAPREATLINNGNTVANPPVFEPKPSDCTVTLYADWSGSVEGLGSTLGGIAKSDIKVRLVSAYTYEGVTFETTTADTKPTISGVTYNAPIEASKLSGLSAPVFKEQDGKNLVFKGFYTEMNLSTPEPGKTSYNGSCVIGVDEAGKLVPAAPFKKLQEINGFVEVYALWAYPVSNVVFHKNLDGCAPEAYSDAVADETNLMRTTDGVYMLEAKTNEDTPAVTFSQPANSPYEFNGWWTHPYKERAGSTQYYDANGNVVAAKQTWDLYTDVVLYAHWKYDIEFDPSDGILKVGLDAEDDGSYDTYGNRYDFNDEGVPGSGLKSIHAILGAPVYLPEANQPGYDGTTDWGVGDTDEDGRTTDDEGTPTKPTVPAGQSPVTVTPNFEGKAHVFTVTLDAGTDAKNLDENETAWTNQVLTGVTYDKTLAAVGIASVDVPYRNGYTFQGFEDESGKQYVNVNGTTVNTPWTTTSADKNVTLTAQWTQDEYAVRYDLTAPNFGLDKEEGAGSVQGGTSNPTEKWTYGAPVAHDGGIFPVDAENPNSLGTTKFYRNGYDFEGWYWLEDGVQHMVSDAQGNPTGSFKPSLSWQQDHKGQPVTLYAEWTPKVYALVFDTDYQEQAKVDPAPYVEVAYGEDVTPFTSDGSAAVPTDDPFAFAGWKWQSGSDSWTLFPEAPATTVSGAFTPAWPLSTLDKGNPGVVRTVTFTAQWNSPKKVEVVLSSGEHGSFNTPFEGMRDTFVSAESNKDKVTFRGVDYTDKAFDLGSVTSPLYPASDDGFTFLGFVKTDRYGYILDKNGVATTEKSPYDNGQVREDVKPLLVKSLSKLTDDTYAMAVYSADAMTVTLDMNKSNVELYEGYEAYDFYDRAGDAYVKQDVPRTSYGFDVRDIAFKLPAEVIVAGYDFEGWVPSTNVNAKPSKDVTVDPAAIAAEVSETGDTNLLHQSYYPRFTKKDYIVSFCPNYGAGSGMDATKTATVDFEGKVVDAGDFKNLKAGEVLPIAPMPAPRTSYDEGSSTYKSYPFSGWCVGDDNADEGVLQKADARPTSAEWSAWIAEYATSTLGTNETSELPIYALWVTNVSAMVPLTANVAIDPDTARVAIVEDGYWIRTSSAAAELEVASLRYQSLKSDASRGNNAFALTGDDHAYLTVFANAKEAPDMGEPTLDEDGYVSGDYGVNSSTLLFDLNSDDVVISGTDLKNRYGFTKFSTGDKRLKMHYGLSLDGIHISKVRALRENLPDINGATDERTWTKASVPVARLLYTIQLAETE